MRDELRKVVRGEINKLLKAQFIREVRYSTWLANIVMVRKANEKWCMCTDYTTSTRHVPKIRIPYPASTNSWTVCLASHLKEVSLAIREVYVAKL